jgi:hypothetical protein
MNRSQRRARQRAESRRRNGPVITGQVLVGSPDVLAGLWVRCPDCNSETDRWTDSDGGEHIDLAHDDSCPVWRAMQRRGAR